MLQSLFDSGLLFTEFLERAKTNAALWRDTYRLTRSSPDAVARLAGVPGRWHLLVMLEDWCGDGVNIVPVLARLAELAPNVDLRVIGRDEHAELMDTHLTCGARSIPIVIVLDEDFVERGWWGPRPRALQELAMGEWATLPKDERYRSIRTWYARDRGRTTVAEILETIEHAAMLRAVPSGGPDGDHLPVRRDWDCERWARVVAQR